MKVHHEPLLTQGKRRERGFTLVETVVAIFILVLAIGAPLTLAAQSLFGAFAARDQMVASFLAQDAVEAIRAERDEFILRGEADPFDQPGDSLGECIIPSNQYGCRIETKGNIERKIKNAGSEYDKLFYDTTTGIYGFKDATQATPFTRIIKLTKLTDDEYKLTVTITWQIRNFTRTFTVEEILSAWVDLSP